VGEAVKFVSVILPVHNEERYLGETLKSLTKQDYPNLEILVVDDDSSDRTFVIAKEYENRFPDKIRVFRKRKELSNSILVAKSYFARKLAFTESKGDYLLDFSGHIIVPKNFVTVYVGELEKNCVDMVGCRIFPTSGLLMKVLFHLWMLSGSVYYPMFRKTKVNKYPCGEDAELDLELKKYRTSKTFVLYRGQTIRRFLHRMLVYGNARAWLMKKYGFNPKYVILGLLSLFFGYGVGFLMGVFGVDVRRRFGW